MFIGRTEELQSLNKLYTKDNFQMVVMYGRRRVGKTTLILKFLEHKPCIFFTAQEANDKINLNAFSEKISKAEPETLSLTVKYLQMLCQTLSESLHLKRFAWNI